MICPHCHREIPEAPAKRSIAAELGARGGAATAAGRTKRQRSKAARKAVRARWAKHEARKSNG